MTIFQKVLNALTFGRFNSDELSHEHSNDVSTPPKICRSKLGNRCYAIGTYSAKYYYYPLANVSSPKAWSKSIVWPLDGDGNIYFQYNVNLKQGLTAQRIMPQAEMGDVAQFYPSDEELLFAVNCAFFHEVYNKRNSTYQQYADWMRSITCPIVREFMDGEYGKKLHEKEFASKVDETEKVLTA
tara:strand:- start:1964 stop:2515 length:552 start_codon:yes stop_codon:yes gene_type:complete